MPARPTDVEQFGRELLRGRGRRFWSPERELFVNNLPWLAQEKTPRTCDRSLATAILFDQCPGNKTDAAVRMLADCPPEMGFSYPANAGWRLWALARGGRADVIVKDLRQRWATMDSVQLNNTLQEDWTAQPGQRPAMEPLRRGAALHRHPGTGRHPPACAGFRRAEVQPQLADLHAIALTVHTVRGPFQFTARAHPAVAS